MGYCPDCGCKSYNGACTNCHEELYIIDQYYEMEGELEYPLSDEFVEKVELQRADVKAKKQKP